MASTTVLDPRTPVVPGAPDRRRPPPTVVAAAAVAGVEAVGLVAGALTGLDGLLLSPLRPSGLVVATVLLLLAVWVVLCAGGGVLLADGSGRRLYTGVAVTEVGLVAVLLGLSLGTPLLDGLPASLPGPALALLALGVPVGKLLLAGAPTAVAWGAAGPRARARQPEPAPGPPALRAATLGVIALALVTIALVTPTPQAATGSSTTAGTSQP
ncbi:hypothetical protein ACI79C_12905 [Geodermatophilus sp. SYSU D00697]